MVGRHRRHHELIWEGGWRVSVNRKMPFRGVVKKSNRRHQEPRSDRYIEDQQLQRFARDRERLRQYGLRKQEFYGRAVIPLEAVLTKLDDSRWERDELKFVLDRNGDEITETEHDALLKTMSETRGKYRRPDGKWERLRERKTIWVKDPETRKFRKLRVETPAAKVSAVRYEAYMFQPHHSAGLVLACLGGRGGLARTLAEEICKEAMREVERVTGYQCVAGPCHPKLFATHLQISTVRVSADFKLLREADLAHLGRKIQGAWTLSEVFEIKGEKLDQLTGHEDAQKGIDEAVADRGERAVDFILYKFIAARFEAKLGEPRFRVLAPFVAQGRQLVLRYQDQLLDFLRDPDEQIEKAEKRGRDEGLKLGAADNVFLRETVLNQTNQISSLEIKTHELTTGMAIARGQIEATAKTADTMLSQVASLTRVGLKTLLSLLVKADAGERLGAEAGDYICVGADGVARTNAEWLERAREFEFYPEMAVVAKQVLARSHAQPPYPTEAEVVASPVVTLPIQEAVTDPAAPIPIYDNRNCFNPALAAAFVTHLKEQASSMAIAARNSAPSPTALDAPHPIDVTLATTKEESAFPIVDSEDVAPSHVSVLVTPVSPEAEFSPVLVAVNTKDNETPNDEHINDLRTPKAVLETPQPDQVDTPATSTVEPAPAGLSGAVDDTDAIVKSAPVLKIAEREVPGSTIVSIAHWASELPPDEILAAIDAASEALGRIQESSALIDQDRAFFRWDDDHGFVPTEKTRSILAGYSQNGEVMKLSSDLKTFLEVTQPALMSKHHGSTTPTQSMGLD